MFFCPLYLVRVRRMVEGVSIQLSIQKNGWHEHFQFQFLFRFRFQFRFQTICLRGTSPCIFICKCSCSVWVWDALTWLELSFRWSWSWIWSRESDNIEITRTSMKFKPLNILSWLAIKNFNSSLFDHAKQNYDESNELFH